MTPSTANEKVLKAYDEKFADTSTTSKAMIKLQSKAFLLQALSDRAEEIAVELERTYIYERDFSPKEAAEIARSFTH